MAVHSSWINAVSFLLILVMVMMMTMTMPSMGKPSFSHQFHVQIRNQLKRLNKPAVKSIKSPDGDIIDCVRITNQPAFDHPSLKNHTVQVPPNFHPGNVIAKDNVSSDSKEIPKSTILQLWQMNGKCPENTIPIRRTRRSHILRANSINNYGKKMYKTIPRPTWFHPNDLESHNNHEYAITDVKAEKLYGTKATLNVWNPQLQLDSEFSVSQIWIVAGTFFCGSQSYRSWLAGFVQTKSEIALGGTLSPVSIYGRTQNEISLQIWKDPKTQNWWLQFGENKLIGYWPASIFSHLSESATMIQWGGEIINEQTNGLHTTTQMGSGHFADEGLGKASFFRNILIVDESSNLNAPQTFEITTRQPNCYNVKTGYSAEFGSHFFYGGPGRNSNCP